MADYFDLTSEQFKSIRAELAGDTLPPSFAKLYSQYTRVRMNQPGLRGWRSEDFSARLADAVTLIDVGLYERDMGGEDWRSALKRAGELLEWLSHPNLNTDRLPLRLLSAGVYQLAGYPALALGLLNSEAPDSGDSQILTSLLMADFPKLHTLINDYWGKELVVARDRKGKNFRQIHTSDFKGRFVDEIIKALGILCAYMRWGDTDRLEKAQQKLQYLSELMIYSKDSYSWLLSKVVSEVVREYVNSSMRVYVEKLQNGVSDYGKRAFERYLRSNYRSRKSLAWYSQVRGIERLLVDGSFALCTPTGSGKTTIAELAIIQSMFPTKDEELFSSVGPITMYLVPSRSLATEVESKLGTVLGKLGSYSVKVTGLYGGIDWGPMDAWVTSTDPTVLVCTYEKAEALIRFLGPLFLNRVSLVVIDEAHSVQFNGKGYDGLVNADDRSLRLEMLANRLLQYIGQKRIIALSAVADENESLAHWVAGSETATPVVSTYRSTRQLIGRLEWSRSGEYEIFYDILNGHYLGFSGDGGRDNVPYIQKPFTPFPIPYQSLPKKYKNEKVGKRQRPYLFWAALQLAQPDEQGKQHSVLISVTQNISGYAKDFLWVLNKKLVQQQLPKFFTPPSDPERLALFEKCLNACEDYFGKESYEYQLLKKGIVVHHGNMPGIMARLLVELLQKRVVHIALATSTLSEGVNLPFEIVIIPTLVRDQEPLPVSEFKNLVGRAGRPGWGTEGRTLVFLESRPSDYSSQTARKNYKTIIDRITQEQLPKDGATESSPLGALMTYIAKKWVQISGSRSQAKFMEWLEKTAPLTDSVEGDERDLQEALDSLDGYLLSIIVEQEAMSDEEMSKSDLENHLIDVWRKTYAYYVMKNKEFWENVFVTRGSAIRESIYPDYDTRRHLYRTSVSPRFGKRVLDGYRRIRDHLLTGTDYSEWSTEERLKYIVKTVDQISSLEKFKVSDGYGSGKSFRKWDEILKWWLNPSGSVQKPTKNQVSGWIKFIKKNFEYLFNWGLGTVIALIWDDANEGVLREITIEDWPKTGLPWIVFWLKELITWGTLDPVAALLLAHGIDHTRSAAETRAQDYYAISTGLPVDEVLNPRRIKEWADKFVDNEISLSAESYPKEIKVELTRDFSKAKVKDWRVVPVITEDTIRWIDPAGYEFAISEIPSQWHKNMELTHDFILNTDTKTVKVFRYL